MSAQKELHKAIASLSKQTSNCLESGNDLWLRLSSDALAAALSKIEAVSNARLESYTDGKMIILCSYGVLNRQMEIEETDVKITVTADLIDGVTVKVKQCGEVIPHKLFAQCHKAELENSVRSQLLAQYDQYSFYL